jgi:hypothetical protein
MARSQQVRAPYTQRIADNKFIAADRILAIELVL